MSHALSSKACCLHLQTPFGAVPSPTCVHSDADGRLPSSHILWQSLTLLRAFAYMAESHYPTLHPSVFLPQFLTYIMPFLSFYILL